MVKALDAKMECLGRSHPTISTAAIHSQKNTYRKCLTVIPRTHVFTTT
jgi:hypothetical protein